MGPDWRQGGVELGGAEGGKTVINQDISGEKKIYFQFRKENQARLVKVTLILVYKRPNTPEPIFSWMFKSNMMPA